MTTQNNITLPAKFKKNLVAYWKGDGNAQDSVGNNHGTPTPTGVTFAKGHRNKAFSFDGTVGNVVTPLIFSYKKGITIDLWIKTAVDAAMVIADGVSTGYGTAKTPVDKGSTSICIGGHDLIGYNKFKGLIDEIKIYDRALDPSEIKELYDSY